MRTFIDFLVIWAVVMVIHAAYGWWWAAAAAAAVCGYGVFCFADGLQRGLQRGLQ